MDDVDQDEVATLCDVCSTPILYGRRAYVVPNGEVDEDGTPFINLLCHNCKDKQL